MHARVVLLVMYIRITDKSDISLHESLWYLVCKTNTPTNNDAYQHNHSHLHFVNKNMGLEYNIGHHTITPVVSCAVMGSASRRSFEFTHLVLPNLKPSNTCIMIHPIAVLVH